MSAKPTKRNWNDVQTAIATAAIVTTLGMWNLFAAPAKTANAQEPEATLPPTEPPTEPPASPEPTALPYVKIMFTPMAPETTTTVQQTQPEVKKKKKREKRRNSGGGGGGGAPVTSTQSS